MADLTGIQATEATRLVGAAADGTEQTPVQSTANGALHTNPRNSAGTELGTSSNPMFVRGSDGTDLQAFTSTGSAKSVDGLSSGVYSAISVPAANTPVELKVGGSKLANRKFLQFVPSQAGFFWGLDASVTTATGTPLANGQILQFAIDPDSTFSVWVVRGSAGGTGRVVEAT